MAIRQLAPVAPSTGSRSRASNHGACRPGAQIPVADGPLSAVAEQDGEPLTSVVVFDVDHWPVQQVDRADPHTP